MLWGFKGGQVGFYCLKELIEGKELKNQGYINTNRHNLNNCDQTADTMNYAALENSSNFVERFSNW